VAVAASEGRLIDPATRPFRPWPREWKHNGYLYSRFQLLSARSIKLTLTAMRARRGDTGIEWDLDLADARHVDVAARQRALAVALEVLAPRYLPRVTRRVRLDLIEEEAVHDFYASATRIPSAACCGIDHYGSSIKQRTFSDWRGPSIRWATGLECCESAIPFAGMTCASTR
jgi:hypothetical protein